MKILIINPNFWLYGGAESLIVKFCNYCSDHYIQTTILTSQMIDEVRKELFDTRLLFCKDIAEMSNILHLIHSDFDAIFYHNSPVELLSYGIKTKNVWMCNEPQSYLQLGYVPDKEKEIVNNFIDTIIVADEFNQKRIKELYGKNSKIINYGIEYDFFSKGDKQKAIEKYSLEGKFVITQVGFVHQTKNNKFTYEIFKKVLKIMPNAYLLFVGYDKTPYAEELKNQIMKDGNIQNVFFTGPINREEIRNIYQATNVVLMPVKSQGSWLSVFEAMSAGCPVIVSKEMTASSILKKEKIGQICDKIEDYVAYIKDWDHNQDKDLAIKFVKELTWEKFSKKVLEVLKK